MNNWFKFGVIFRLFPVFVTVVFFSVSSAHSSDFNACKTLFNDQKYTSATQCFGSIVRFNEKDVQSRFWYAAALFYDRQYNLSYGQYLYISQKYPNTEIGKYSKAEAEKVRQKMIFVQKEKANDKGDYLSSLEKTTRWYKMPIKVWIQPGQYRNYSINAFKEWQMKSQNTVSFFYVTTESQAQIKVYFVDSINGSIADDNIGLTNLKYIGNMNTSAVIQILQRTESKKIRSLSQVYPVVLHEIGHALGIHGHSTSTNDILYPNNYTNDVHLSNKDINTLKAIYRK